MADVIIGLLGFGEDFGLCIGPETVGGELSDAIGAVPNRGIDVSAVQLLIRDQDRRPVLSELPPVAVAQELVAQGR